MADALPPVALLFALRRETRGFWTQFTRLDGSPLAGPCRVQRCSLGLVLETGVGVERTRAALEWLLRSAGQIRLVIAAGFAGALDDRLRVGDIIVGAEVADAEGRIWPASWPQSVPAPAQTGCVLTMPRLIGEPSEKRRLGERFAAQAVDMESACVAEFCGQRGIAFGCVRAISDDVQTTLSPRLVNLLSKERVSWWRFAAATLRSPRLIGECCRLAKSTSLASKRLGQFLKSLAPPG